MAGTVSAGTALVAAASAALVAMVACLTYSMCVVARCSALVPLWAYPCCVFAVQMFAGMGGMGGGMGGGGSRFYRG